MAISSGGIAADQLNQKVTSAMESHTDRSTHFVFHHKLFTRTGAVFKLSASKEPMLEVSLGENKAQIPLKAAMAEFAMEDEGQADTEMIGKVIRGLQYVRLIRPGDSIPNELLDGSASWSVEDRHILIARGRVTMQLVSWINGVETVIFDLAQLEQIVSDPLTRNRVNLAVTSICAKLGIAADKRQTVLDHVDQLANELSYVEALRDYAGGMNRLTDKVNQFLRLYAGDHTFSEDLQRIKTLLKKPVSQIEQYFMQADAQTAEILTALRNFDATVDFIRHIRDEIHFTLLNWEEYFQTGDALIVERSRPNEVKLRQIYGFLARNFPESKEWTLMSSQFKSNPRATTTLGRH